MLGKQLGILRKVGKIGFIGLVAAMLIVQAMTMAEFEALAMRSPLEGVYEVEGFTLDGTKLEPTDDRRWRQFVIGEYPYAAIRPRAGERTFFGFTHDAEAGTITLAERGPEPQVEHVLTVAQPAVGELVLTGSVGHGAIEARLRRIETEKMLLVTRGFRWVNERPYNR